MEYNEYKEMQERFLNKRCDDIRRYLKAEKEQFLKEEQADRWKRFDFMKSVVWPLALCIGMFALMAHYASMDEQITICLVIGGFLVAFWISEIVKEEQRIAVEMVFRYSERQSLTRQYIIDHRDEILAEAETPEEMEKLQDFIHLSLLYIYDPNSDWDISIY